MISVGVSSPGLRISVGMSLLAMSEQDQPRSPGRRSQRSTGPSWEEVAQVAARTPEPRNRPLPWVWPPALLIRMGREAL